MAVADSSPFQLSVELTVWVRGECRGVVAKGNAHLSEINDFYLQINAVVAGAEANVIDASDALNVINMRCVCMCISVCVCVCLCWSAGYRMTGFAGNRRQRQRCCCCCCCCWRVH